MPSELNVRADGEPGRPGRHYSTDALIQAQQNLRFLHAHARRGRSAGALALLLKANGLYASHQATTEALTNYVIKVRAELAKSVRQAASEGRPVPIEWRLSDEYEAAEAMAGRELARKGELARSVRRQLRRAGGPHGDHEVLQTLVAMYATALGEPPAADDVETYDKLLHAFGAHGLIEPITPGGPVVVPEGPSGLADALRLFAGLGILDLPIDFTECEIDDCLAFCRTAAAALGSIPQGADLLRHHVGGAGVLGFWKDDDPEAIALCLLLFVRILRTTTLDLSPIVSAVTEQGWYRPDAPL